MGGYAIPVQMSTILTEPEEGDIELAVDKDDPNFKILDDTIETVTGFIADCQGLVGKVGIDFPGPTIEKTDADELFVKPLSGDWNKIVACGDALAKAGKGLTQVGENLGFGLTQTFVDSGGVWKGDSAESAYAHFGIHAAAYAGLGLVMKAGEIVFVGISEVCQEIAQLLRKLIDAAIDIAIYLGKKIATYGRPWIGLIQLGVDVVKDGWDAIQNIIDALWDLADTIKSVFELHDAVKAWVETIPEELKLYEDLKKTVEKIPDLADTPVLTTRELINDFNGIGNRAGELDKARQNAEKKAKKITKELDDQSKEAEKPEVPEDISGIDVPDTDY